MPPDPSGYAYAAVQVHVMLYYALPKCVQQRCRISNSCRLHCLSNYRRHLSCDDCLEGKNEAYQNCSALYCVPHLYTVISTQI